MTHIESIVRKALAAISTEGSVTGNEILDICEGFTCGLIARITEGCEAEDVQEMKLAYLSGLMEEWGIDPMDFAIEHGRKMKP